MTNQKHFSSVKIIISPAVTPLLRKNPIIHNSLENQYQGLQPQFAESSTTLGPVSQCILAIYCTNRYYIEQVVIKVNNPKILIRNHNFPIFILPTFSLKVRSLCPSIKSCPCYKFLTLIHSFVCGIGVAWWLNLGKLLLSGSNLNLSVSSSYQVCGVAARQPRTIDKYRCLYVQLSSQLFLNNLQLY